MLDINKNKEIAIKVIKKIKQQNYDSCFSRKFLKRFCSLCSRKGTIDSRSYIRHRDLLNIYLSIQKHIVYTV